jgi:hypothetical protein
VLDISRYDLIDWDDPEVDDNPETNNLLHCQQAGRLGVQAETIVYEIFSGGPWAEVRFTMQTAEYAVVGAALANLWLVLFKDSPKRGDWLRPVTGWPAERAEIKEWEQATSETWKGRR